MRSPTRLLLVALAASLPSCERHSTAQNDAEWWRLEGDREASAQRLTLLQTRFERATAVQLEVDSIFASTGNLAQAKRTLESQRAQISADIAALDDQVQDARHQWAAAKRSATVGRSFTSLTSRAGRTYENVTVTRVTDAGIEFRHQNGSGRFSALEMTPQQMDDFGIESADAIAAHQQERADAHAYNRAVDKAVADNKADRDHSDSNSSSRSSNSNRSGGNSSGGSSNDSGRSTASNSGSSRGGSPALASNGGSRSRLDEPPRFFSSRLPRAYYRGASYYYGSGYSWPSGVYHSGGNVSAPTSPPSSGRTSPTGPVVVQPPAPRPTPPPRTPATPPAATP